MIAGKALHSIAVAAVTFVLVALFVPRGDAPSVISAVPSKSDRAQQVPAAVTRFSWAPVKGAEGYRFVVFSGNRIAFDKTVAGPAATVRLRRGMYHWVVWPVVHGEEAGSTVSSHIRVS